MNKTTIELDRAKGHWSNWGVMMDKWGGGNDSPIILDALVEWSKANPTQQIYRHVRRSAEENVEKETTLVETTYDKQCPVRLCDRVQYLDIYHQDK